MRFDGEVHHDSCFDVDVREHGFLGNLLGLELLGLVETLFTAYMVFVVAVHGPDVIFGLLESLVDGLLVDELLLMVVILGRLLLGLVELLLLVVILGV